MLHIGRKGISLASYDGRWQKNNLESELQKPKPEKYHPILPLLENWQEELDIRPRYPSVKLPQSPRKIELVYCYRQRKPSKHPISKVDIHVTEETPAKYPTTDTAKSPNKVIPDASPSNPSMRFIALAIPTIHTQESPKPNHSGKVSVPSPKKLDGNER